MPGHRVGSGKTEAPSAFAGAPRPELPGSGDRHPRGLALQSQPVASVPRRGCSLALGTPKRDSLHPGKLPPPPAACEDRGCGMGRSTTSKRNWEQKGILRSAISKEEIYFFKNI